MYYSEQVNLPKTDPLRWRLRTDELGRETWHYLNPKDAQSEPQSDVTKYLLDLDFERPPKSQILTPLDAAKKGALFFSRIQEDSGIFPVQYKGPMFMNIGMVAASYFTKTELPQPVRVEMVRYIVNTAHPVDGGWGLHSVDKSTVFGTTMNYLCLRLLGVPADHEVCVRARATLHKLGGAVQNPHWGKAWLALLNLYKWEGVNPAPPELWMLPYALPIHPGRWWVHTRAIYLPLAYLSANRSQCPLDPLLEEIRLEIYTKPYDAIPFEKHRNTVSGVDLYYPHTRVLDAMNWAVVQYEKWRPQWLLKRASKRVYELIQKECRNTDYLCIAPVSFCFNMIVTYLEEGRLPAFSKFVERRGDVLFHGPQGMTVMGTNGVQLWDVAFMCQYLTGVGLARFPEFHDMLLKGYWFLRRLQFTEECEPGSYRDLRRGAWPFSTKTQGYTVSDCTAEALKAIIMVENNEHLGPLIADKIDPELLECAVDRILAIQNTGSFEPGSFSAYEKIRALPMLEWLSPAEVFNNIMVEYPYVECTDLLVLGLHYFAQHFPAYKAVPIAFAIDGALEYIRRAQAQDGLWYGSWGVCYTYAAMFAIEALETAGQGYLNLETVRRGCDFLVAKQRLDGGWSETMKLCETHSYVQGPHSMVVQTAWAAIALLLADYPERQAVDRAIAFLMAKQLERGEWFFDGIEGVFNHSCAIEYPTYKFVFPIKALGLYHAKYN